MSQEDENVELKRQINEMNEAYAKILPGLIQNLQAMQMAVGGNAKGTADSLNNLTKATKDQTEAEKAQTAAAEASRKAKANYDSAVESSKTALKNFAGAMTNTSTEFSKFNSTLSSAGDAAFNLAKNFGPLGFVVGGLIKGFTMAAEMATKQADSALKATDEMSKMGGAGAHTAKSVAEMATKIGLNDQCHEACQYWYGRTRLNCRRRTKSVW
jgi:phage-related protein